MIAVAIVANSLSSLDMSLMSNNVTLLRMLNKLQYIDKLLSNIKENDEKSVDEYIPSLAQWWGNIKI